MNGQIGSVWEEECRTVRVRNRDVRVSEDRSLVLDEKHELPIEVAPRDEHAADLAVGQAEAEGRLLGEAHRPPLAVMVANRHRVLALAHVLAIFRNC